MNILEWNINQRSSFGGGTIPSLVINEIEKANADVVCLTEYVRGEEHTTFCEKISELGYSAFLAPTLNNNILKNEIFLAVKTNLVKNPEIKTIEVKKIVPGLKEKCTPDFLHLQLDFEGEPLHIIGARIKIEGLITGPSKIKLARSIEEAKERLYQVKRIIDYIKEEVTEGRIIVLGDFNNFHYLENQTISSWEEDEEYLQNYYSYPLLVQTFSDIGLSAYTPKGENNEVYSWVNTKLSEENPKRYIRNDHLFTNATASNVHYDWDFLQNTSYRSQVGFPDHAKLTATVTF